MSLSNDQVVLLLRALKGITGNPDQCFTAYDITKATRSLTEDNIRHGDVREVVHTFYDQGFLNLYTRQHHDFWSDADQDCRAAQLFVPPNGDPSSYDPHKVQMVKDDNDDGQVLLQDSDGNALITVGAVAQLPLSDDSADSVTPPDDSVVVNVVVSDPTAAPKPGLSPVIPDQLPVSKPTDPKRSGSLFDLIKRKLTKLPSLWAQARNVAD